MNAKHAQDVAHCTNAAAIAGMLRGLDDAAFDKSGAMLAGAPPMSAGQLAGGLLSWPPTLAALATGPHPPPGRATRISWKIGRSGR
jgi:hypothetical protein